MTIAYTFQLHETATVLYIRFKVSSLVQDLPTKYTKNKYHIVMYIMLNFIVPVCVWGEDV
jgi:hypothetical protein